MTEFSKRAIKIIKNIPEGKVTSYGKIASIAGNPKGARMISRLLSSSSQKYNLPWHRVIGSDGKISFRNELAVQEQKSRLEAEGVTFSGNKISSHDYWWDQLSFDDILFDI